MYGLSGGSRGGAQAIIFRPNWSPKGPKKLFFETTPHPFSEGLDLPLVLPSEQKKWLLQRGGHNCVEVAVSEDSTVPWKRFAKEVLFEWKHHYTGLHP